jgi:hypothetical protein
MTEATATPQATTPNDGASASATVAPAPAAAATATTPAQQAAPAQPVATPEAKPDPATEAAKEPAAPEKYVFKAPEGKEYSPEALTAFEQAARDSNMPQDAAQKFLDKLAPAMEERAKNALDTTLTKWEEAARTDKEIGGDKFDENLGLAKKALETFGSPELTEMLRTSGLGSNPEIIRAFYKIGKAISEDAFVSGRAGAKPVTVAQRMYPNMNP